jgi:hypothetical protein
MLAKGFGRAERVGFKTKYFISKTYAKNNLLLLCKGRGKGKVNLISCQICNVFG